MGESLRHISTFRPVVWIALCFFGAEPLSAGRLSRFFGRARSGLTHWLKTPPPRAKKVPEFGGLNLRLDIEKPAEYQASKKLILFLRQLSEFAECELDPEAINEAESIEFKNEHVHIEVIRKDYQDATIIIRSLDDSNASSDDPIEIEINNDSDSEMALSLALSFINPELPDEIEEKAPEDITIDARESLEMVRLFFFDHNINTPDPNIPDSAMLAANLDPTTHLPLGENPEDDDSFWEPLEIKTDG